MHRERAHLHSIESFSSHVEASRHLAQADAVSVSVRVSNTKLGHAKKIFDNHFIKGIGHTEQIVRDLLDVISHTRTCIKDKNDINLIFRACSNDMVGDAT